MILRSNPETLAAALAPRSYAHLTNVKLWAWNRATAMYYLGSASPSGPLDYARALAYLCIVAPELASPLAVAHGH